MEEIRPFIGAVALWIGISCGLWWLRRRSVRGRQDRQREQAARAAAHVGEAQAVFDAIRTPVPLKAPPAETNAWLRAETYALLKRIQEHGPFFDKAKTLRVQIQSSLGIDDHGPLSELLNLRRDLWAASEVVLVEDPGSFGATFAEAGSYERFRAEALSLLFKKRDGAADEDLIQLRLVLAREEADRFSVELEEAIAIAREQNRLPTLAEIIAYPLAVLRAIPQALRTAGAFLRAFFAYAGDAARAIRESEAMTRGASRLREAREDWPQRLSGGFEHVSAAARDSTTAIRRHYDFLVAAYDFQAKYERIVRRTPEITDRGRQFIARLELADRSERLRLTSANAAIWMARGLLNGLAHLLAGIARLHTALRETAPWAFAAAFLGPAPLTGRRRSAFRSYRMALAAGGLSEMPFDRQWRLEPAPASPQAAPTKAKAKSKAKPAKVAPVAKAKAASPEREAAAARPANVAAPPAAKSAAGAGKQRARAAAAVEIAAKAKIEPLPVAASASTEVPLAAQAKAASGAVRPDHEKAEKAPSRSLFGLFKPRRRPVAGKPIEVEKPLVAPSPPTPIGASQPKAALRSLDECRLTIEAVATPEAAAPDPLADDAPLPVGEAMKRRRPSFLKRLFGKVTSDSADAVHANAEAEHMDGAASLPRPDPATEAGPAPQAEPPPKLMDKLSSLELAEPEIAGDDEQEDEDVAVDAALLEAGEEDDAGEPGPLTLSILELQAKIKPKAPQIRSFPWLRG